MDSTTYLHDEHNVLIAVGPLVVQVRRGDLTGEFIERISSLGGLLRAANRGRVAFLAIVEAGASTTTGEARRRQGEAIRRFSGERSAPIAVINEDTDGASAMLRRVDVRKHAKAGADVQVFGSVAQAAVWIAKALDGVMSAAEIVEASEVARRLSRKGN